MDNNSRKIVEFIQSLQSKVIDCYKDETYAIEVDFNGSMQIKGIRFHQSYQMKELEQILPTVFEKGAERAGKKLNLLLQQFQDDIKKGQT